MPAQFINIDCTYGLMESTLKYSWVGIVSAPCVFGAISSTDVGFWKSVNNIHLCVFQWESEDGVSKGTARENSDLFQINSFSK